MKIKNIPKHHPYIYIVIDINADFRGYTTLENVT